MDYWTWYKDNLLYYRRWFERMAYEEELIKTMLEINNEHLNQRD